MTSIAEFIGLTSVLMGISAVPLPINLILIGGLIGMTTYIVIDIAKDVIPFT